MALTLKQIPTELIDSYIANKCGVFVGAGLSRGVGYPDWKGLLDSMIKKAQSNHSLNPDQAKEFRKLAKNPHKFLMLAQELKELLGVEFKTVLEETFGDDARTPGVAHDLLVTLKRNNFIITTNYDLLIEKAFVNRKVLQTPYKYYEAHAIQRQLYLREFFLLKAHGDAKTAAEQIVLTDKDYRKLLYQQPGYQSVLQSVFTMYSVIFIGCSLDDPELRMLLNYINAAFPEGGVPHYALMATENTGAAERGRWKKDYNMRMISISSDDNYRDIEVFLKLLHRKEAEADSKVVSAGKPKKI